MSEYLSKYGFIIFSVHADHMNRHVIKYDLMTCVMRKFRSACAPAQSDQRFVGHSEDRKGPKFVLTFVSRRAKTSKTERIHRLTRIFTGHMP